MKQATRKISRTSLVPLNRPQTAPSLSEPVAEPDPGTPPIAKLWSDTRQYQVDFIHRSVLFLDSLRERANNMLAHEQAGLPPLLDFEYETILDARRFKHPANYALLRISGSGQDRIEDCVDENKRPVIIIDPRAEFKKVRKVSEFNEHRMTGVAALAPWARAQRQPASADNPLVAAERGLSGQISGSLDARRTFRDEARESVFHALYR